MSSTTIIYLLIIGLVAGIASSMVGIGGGIIIVPCLVFLLGFDQKMAQGTSIFLLVFPIGLLGALTYYKAGNVNISAAFYMLVTFVLGSYIGAVFVGKLDTSVVKKIFAIFMILMALKYLFFDKKNPKIDSKISSTQSTKI